MASDRRPDLLRYSTAGIQFIATFGVFLGGGLWLDFRLDTLPGFTLLLGAVGFGLALWRLVRRGQEAREDRGLLDGRDDTER